MRNKFILVDPVGQPTRRGSDMRWLSSLLHGVNKSVTGTDRFADSRVTILGQDVKLKPIASFWDSDSVAGIIKNSVGKELSIPLTDIKQELNSFALHILLMAMSVDHVWKQDVLEDIAMKANHHLAIVNYCRLHGTQPERINAIDIDKILLACPDSGPASNVDAATGWSHDNRWIRCTNIFEATNGAKEYNGLDWLVLFVSQD